MKRIELCWLFLVFFGYSVSLCSAIAARAVDRFLTAVSRDPVEYCFSPKNAVNAVPHFYPTINGDKIDRNC